MRSFRERICIRCKRSRLESICGNVAPNLALDGAETFYDACQHRKYRARFFAERTGREGLFPAHAAEKRPRGCRVFQDFVSGLPVHLSLLGAALQTIWRGEGRDVWAFSCVSPCDSTRCLPI